ncbi:EAL domain-containing protein [Hathewaya limosa]|uniref:Diguanylate cyclase (GGDEF)-like protein n=1 Tax=Hathewaya limosa TaxID=1536 RepID=A0ABU0JQB3_HATLI|nr:EAL domain-containing protein [Hathewaya limosa]MDQ0479282.1 diguanylate cyclase (GGDEF)-like protein [Hathewaya limosa]
MDIKTKLPLSMVILLVTPLILLGIISYTYASSNLIKISKDNMTHIIKMGSGELQNVIKKQHIETKLMSEKKEVVDFFFKCNNKMFNEEFYNKQTKAIKSILYGSKIVSYDLLNSLIINKDGKVVFNTLQREYAFNFNSVFKENANMLYDTNIITNLKILSKLEGKDSYIITNPIINEDGKFLGVFANVYNYKYLENSLKQVKLGKSGCIICSNLDKNLLLESNNKGAKIIKNPSIEKLINKLGKGKTSSFNGFIKIKEGQEEILIRYNYIPRYKEILMVCQSMKDIKEPAMNIAKMIIIVTIIFLIIGITLTIYLSNCLTKPITNLMHVMERASNGDLNVKHNYNRKNELGRLSQSFNKMIRILKNNYDELSEVYGKLSIAQNELKDKYLQLQNNEKELKRIKDIYTIAVNGSNEAIWEYNNTTNKFYYSEKWNTIVGIDINGGLKFEEILALLCNEEDKEDFQRSYLNYINNDEEFFKYEFKLRDSTDQWILLKGSVNKDKFGNIDRVVGSVSDISERKIAEEQIRFFAYNDPLTELPNKTSFNSDMSKILKNCNSCKGEGGVIFIDIDDFNKINDDLGHNFGDDLLKCVASRLRHKLSNELGLYRFAGDEFIVTIPHIESEEYFRKFCYDLLSYMNGEVCIHGKQIYLSASMGVSRFPRDGNNIDLILKNTHTAMYRAKHLGKNQIEFYSKVMSTELKRHNEIESILRKCIDKDKFIVKYQPQINCNNGEIYGFEALLRLDNNDCGFISPGEFIPIAEESGLIIPIGNLVMKKVCKQNKIWKDKGYNYKKIAVNISAKQLKDERFLDSVKQILKETDLEPKYLEFEITETSVLDSMDSKVGILRKLKNMGISISLDDFGTGYSSLNYLRILPVDNIKIDKSFVDDICDDKVKSSIIDGLIVVAKNMNLSIIAEGVEEPKQYSMLKNKKCDFVQGYLFSKPIMPNEAEELLKKGTKLKL